MAVSLSPIVHLDLSGQLDLGPGTISGKLSVGLFLKDPNQYLSEFWRKPQKTPNG